MNAKSGVQQIFILQQQVLTTIPMVIGLEFHLWPMIIMNSNYLVLMQIQDTLESSLLQSLIWHLIKVIVVISTLEDLVKYPMIQKTMVMEYTG